MRRSISWKLVLAFMLVAFTTAVLVAVFIRITSADRLFQLILDQQRSSLQQILTDYYTANGSWDGIRLYWMQIQRLAEESGTGIPPEDRHEIEDGRRNLFGLTDANGSVIVPVEPDYPVGTRASSDALKSGTPITVDGKRVGTIITSRRPASFNPAESMFLARTNDALIYGMLGALLVALAMGLLLARTLTRPLQALTHAAQNIAQGKLVQEVKITSQDEIGQLAEAFNRMSQEVAKVNQLRRQMTADIAHDLRTPLTVIGGYVESMRDGVLQPTPERLSLIYDEIERLQHLVGDLRMLSQADAGELRLNPQAIQPKAFLEHAAQVFQHHAEQQNVRLTVEASDRLPDIRVDEARMMQVMDNLLSNALRYTPPKGQICLSARLIDGKVEIDIQDTGTGIAAEDLPYIFNRFHRADKSRHTEAGESGLGLAIVKAIVEAHGGRVWADSILEKGTTIHVELPVRPAH